MMYFERRVYPTRDPSREKEALVCAMRTKQKT